MNGADALLATLVANGVTACFANPGTSEMQFVAALDSRPEMRSVLCLFEGVATGAADGYGRLAERPACTLLHLGPGYANGAANLHNARRAFTPLVNIIGDHASFHRQYDAPLNSDIAALAAPSSIWLKSADEPGAVGPLAAEAVAASHGPVPGPASLIVPADSAWLETTGEPVLADLPVRPAPSGKRVDAVARAMRAASNPVVLLGGYGCRQKSLAQTGRLANVGVRVMADTFVSRQPRGAGVFTPERMPYFGEQALAALDGVDLIVLAGTTAPVAFFAYPGRPSLLVPEGCATLALADRWDDTAAALEALADALGAPKAAAIPRAHSPDAAPTGPLSPQTVGVSLARHLPEGAIICDDSVTSGAAVAAATTSAPPHEVLGLTGGAIGIGLPLGIGAAIARPDGKIIVLTGDGSAMYTVQALWTMAREDLDVTVIVFANRSYRILNIEMERMAAGRNGPQAARLLDIGQPDIEWVGLARSLGVPAVRCEQASEFDLVFASAMTARGPSLIEAAIA